MPQREVEVILTRQLASYLAVPVFVVDPGGDLVFFNEPAEPILGRRFEETGEMTQQELIAIFKPTDAEGSPIKFEDHPIGIALAELHPAHRRFRIQGMDGVARTIDCTAIPLLGQAERALGALCVFWEIHDT
jgi:PAS domain-containing protein